MPKMVEVRNLSKRYRNLTAVDGISFDVERGEVLGFLGPNGAGKSTTMKMIAGFLALDAGTVMVGGDDLARRPITVKSRVGYLPEGAPLYGDMSVRRFLSFIADLRGLCGAGKRRALAEAVAKVQLEPVLEQSIETLSKGFKRRVGLAHAIVHDPAVLILDEPTDGLDPNQKHEVRKLIRAMAADKAIVLSTHILEEVDAVCTRAVIMARGRLVADGTPASLEARSPRHNQVTVALPAELVEPARGALAKLRQVAKVEQDSVDGRPVLRILPRNAHAILDDVNALVRQNNWQVNQIYVERGHLDEVFRAVTSGPGADA